MKLDASATTREKATRDNRSDKKRPYAPPPSAATGSAMASAFAKLQGLKKNG
jgi:hypothetical protein